MQTLYIEMTNNTLSRRYKLKMHQTVDVKKLQEIFDCPMFCELIQVACQTI
jgi:hypothetical protein